jgi:hypothetical protein
VRRNPAFRILTAYEDIAAGIRAREMSKQLAAELKPELQISHNVWRFELLGHPQLREYASADAVEADLVIISAHGDEELPGHVKAWIGSWLNQRRKGPCALVALLDQEEIVPGILPPLCVWLRRMAEKGHMDFFCKTGNWAEQDFDYIIDTIHRRAESRSAVLEEILHLELRSLFQWITMDAVSAFRRRNRPGRLAGRSSRIPYFARGR